jgi:hypothetical protein
MGVRQSAGIEPNLRSAGTGRFWVLTRLPDRGILMTSRLSGWHREPRRGHGENLSIFLAPNSMTTSVLDRLLDPVTECLTPDVAERIAALGLDTQTQIRLDELAEKANRGHLTEDERVEYEEYIEGLDLVGILKAKARKALQRSVG